MHKHQFFIGCTTRKGKPLDQGAMFRRAAFLLQEQGIHGCTSHMGYGYWNGQFEQCMILTVIHHYHHGFDMRRLAEKFAEVFDQEEVLLISDTTETSTLTNPRPIGEDDDDHYPWIVVGTQAGPDAPTQYYAYNALTGHKCSTLHPSAGMCGLECRELLQQGA